MSISESQRRLLLGGGTVAGVLIFLGIIAGIQYIILQHPVRWDITGIRQYTLAPQSKKVVEGFRHKGIPIEVLAFFETKDQAGRESVRDLLDQYRDVDPQLTYSFVDPDKERAVAQQHKIETYPTLVIKAGQKEERITTADEETVTNALMRLMRPEEKKVYFLKGHGELAPDTTEADGFSVAKAQIEKQNYKTADLLLVRTPEVPRDATMVVIAGPKSDPLETEVKALRDYVTRGGSLIVLLQPFKTPALCAFFKEFGLETADDIVVDQLSRALGYDYLMPVVTTFESFPITKDFKDSGLITFFPETRSVRAAQQKLPNLEVKELALTSPVSWTINEQQLSSGNARFDEKTGTRGPISVMAVAVLTQAPPSEAKEKKKEGAEGTEPDVKSVGEETAIGPETPATGDAAAKSRKGRIVVFGSSLMGTNKILSASPNTKDLFMNSVSWLAEDENLIAIRPKSLRAEPLVLTVSESLATFLIPVVLVPLAWLFAGILVYLYRRRTLPT